jgi:hypothetical protein
MRTGNAIRFASIALAIMAFCVFAASAGAGQSTAAPHRKITVTGKLTRVMAIGGETSGWSIEFEKEISIGGRKIRSIEITGPLEQFEKLKDQSVRARGTLATRSGMERGEHQVLEISSIRALPQKPK